MANPEHVEILKQGVDTWNEWRKENPEIRPDLRGANLNKTILKGANLSTANLKRSHMSGADLRETDLSRADLTKATISEFSLPADIIWRANLCQANLTGASLRGADLRGANLANAIFRGADSSEADLTNANISGADFRGADLRKIKLKKYDFRGTLLSETNLSGHNLNNEDFSGMDLSGVNLNETSLIKTNFSHANLSNCSIYGIAAWDIQFDEQTVQKNLIITPPYQPAIMVDNLEVAQFIYLLLNHKKLRNVFNAMTERGVLLLGRFGGGGIEVLQAIAAKLREENYLPIIFDFERPQDRNFTETVKTLAGLSRFIIADVSGPSVPQELYATIPHFKIPFVPIIEAGRKPFTMSVDLLEYPWVVRPIVTFASTEDLLEQLPTKVIAPAEEKHQARQRLLDELFGKV